MDRSETAKACLTMSLAAVLSLTAFSCSAPRQEVPLDRTRVQAGISHLETQALVMSMTNPANAIVDRAFWRGAILVCLLVGGLALLRLVPRPIGKKGNT